jgi:predicted site-specific integrase-resolvase
MNRIHNLRELSRALNLSYHTLRRWCRAGRNSNSRTPGGKLCLTDEQIRELLEQMECPREDAAAPTPGR